MTSESKNTSPKQLKFQPTKEITLYFVDIKDNEDENENLGEFITVYITYTNKDQPNNFLEEMTLPVLQVKELIEDRDRIKQSKNPKADEQALARFFTKYFEAHRNNPALRHLYKSYPSFKAAVKVPPQKPRPRHLTPEKEKIAVGKARWKDPKASAPVEAVPLAVLDQSFAFGTPDFYGTPSQSQEDEPLSATPETVTGPTSDTMNRSASNSAQTRSATLGRSASGKSIMTRSQSRSQPSSDSMAHVLAGTPLTRSKGQMGAGDPNQARPTRDNKLQSDTSTSSSSSAAQKPAQDSAQLKPSAGKSKPTQSQSRPSGKAALASTRAVASSGTKEDIEMQTEESALTPPQSFPSNSGLRRNHATGLSSYSQLSAAFAGSGSASSSATGSKVKKEMEEEEPTPQLTRSSRGPAFASSGSAVTPKTASSKTSDSAAHGTADTQRQTRQSTSKPSAPAGGSLFEPAAKRQKVQTGKAAAAKLEAGTKTTSEDSKEATRSNEDSSRKRKR